MRTVTPATTRLTRSQRTAFLSAVLSGTFGTVLVVWGVSIHAATMTGGGVLSVGRALMAMSIVGGIRLARHRSATFPDGLYKLENLIAAMAGGIIVVLAYELARISISHLDGTLIFARDPKHALPFFLAAALLGVVLGFYKLQVSRAEGCPSLAADAYFSFADAAALVIIGVALALDLAGVPGVDAIAGLVVAVVLAAVGVVILHGALRVLLDASVNRRVLGGVRTIAETTPGIRRVVDVDGRNSGSFVFLHLVVEPAAVELTAASEAARDLQRRLKAAYPDIDTVTVEFGPATGDLTAALPIASDGVSIESCLESVPQFAMVVLDNHGKITSRRIVANPAETRREGADVYVSVFLGERSVDLLLVRDAVTDQDAVATLRAYGVALRVTPELETLPQAEAYLTSVVREPETTP